MADKNPWMDPKISEVGGATAVNWQERVQRMGIYYTTNASIGESSWQVTVANAYTHGRDGQNVVFADGHASFEKTADVGVKNDAIYQAVGGGGDEEAKIRRGLAFANDNVHDAALCQPLNASDSFLVGDDVGDPDNHP